MKSRSGFVSNSSSSSFIIGFDTKPKSAAELCELLFGDMDFVQYYDRAYSTTDIANVIFNDLKGQRTASVKKIIETVASGYFPGRKFPDWSDKRPSRKLIKQFEEMFPEYDGDYWQEDKITKTMAKQLAAKIKVAIDIEQKEYEAQEKKAVDEYVNKSVNPVLEGKKVYVLEYSDDCQRHIEHGDVFSGVPHVQISHH